MERKFNIRIVANTASTREKGLMHSSPLDDNEVAFFVFPYANKYAFWNKNVDYNISLAFLDESMKIVHFADLNAQQTKSVGPDKDVRFVIEAKQGVFEKLGINRGDIAKYNTDNTLIIKKG